MEEIEEQNVCMEEVLGLLTNPNDSDSAEDSVVDYGNIPSNLLATTFQRKQCRGNSKENLKQAFTLS